MAQSPGRGWAAGLPRHALPLLMFSALAALPLLAGAGHGYLLAVLTRAMILGLAALSLDLILGLGGLVSFGHAAFVGIGAYAAGILIAHGVDELALQVAAGMVGAVLFAIATGAVSLRTRGVQFIMITLAFGQMLYFLATALAAYGGDDGLSLSGRGRVLGADLFRSDLSFYYLVLAVLAGCYLLCAPMAASRFGRVLRGARDNPRRMAAVGFDIPAHQLVAYVIAGMIAALAGCLLANQAGFVSPAYMTWQRSGELIFMVVLGGVGSLHGAVLGALAFVLAEEVLSGLTDHWRLLFGPLLVLVVLFARGGLTGWSRRGADA
jgi:branched-chain amino acid transport system permease protein